VVGERRQRCSAPRGDGDAFAGKLDVARAVEDVGAAPSVPLGPVRPPVLCQERARAKAEMLAFRTTATFTEVSQLTVWCREPPAGGKLQTKGSRVPAASSRDRVVDQHPFREVGWRTNFLGINCSMAGTHLDFPTPNLGAVRWR
jgi:hypothetical protein